MSEDKRTPLTWTTRDGTVIPLTEMEDGHLMNTIRMLRRRALTKQLHEALQLEQQIACVNGEMAQDYLEWEAREIAEQDVSPARYWPIYDELLSEAWRRGIDEEHLAAGEQT